LNIATGKQGEEKRKRKYAGKEKLGIKKMRRKKTVGWESQKEPSK